MTTFQNGAYSAFTVSGLGAVLSMGDYSNKISYAIARDTYDSTVFGTGGWTDEYAGNKTLTVDFSGNWDATMHAKFIAVLAATDGKVTCVGYPAGNTSGYPKATFDAVVEKYNWDTTPKGLVSFTVGIKNKGAVTDTTV